MNVMEFAKIEIQEVGLDPKNPTRYDLIAAEPLIWFVGYCSSKHEAEYWKEQVEAFCNAAIVVAVSSYNQNK